MKKKKDCSWCFYCEPRGYFFFCGYHSLEIYNPKAAGCKRNTLGKKCSINLPKEVTHHDEETRTYRTI